MLHLPILRAGKPYRSLNVQTVADFRTGEPLAEVSQANPGLIARDLARAGDYQERLGTYPLSELLKICDSAAELFLNGRLPLGDGSQDAEDYCRQVTATTGMPLAMCRANMQKIAKALTHMDEVLQGLARGVNFDELSLSFRREADAMGAILPNNSPGVHSLWLPAIALQVPVILKPGSSEPWTPYRIAQAFMAAGCPAEAFGYYPTDVNGSREILVRCAKSMFFGDAATVADWKGEDRIQVHGPGWSKVILGADKAPQWEAFLDLMEQSVAANGGRSCINASGIWTAGHGRELAEALARRMASIEALPMDHPAARLPAFTNKKLAAMISRKIDADLASGGAEDLTTRYRGGDRLVEVDGAAFLLPTVIWCEEPDHPLARAEYMFPFCSVVQLPQPELAQKIGSTLVATVLSEDRALLDAMFAHRGVDRINAGPVPTHVIRWDQPHEGNLFEFLYRQRAVQFDTFA